LKIRNCTNIEATVGQPASLLRARARKPGMSPAPDRAIADDPTYRRKLLKDLQARRLAPAIEVMLWHYAYGVPKQPVEGKAPRVPLFQIDCLPQLSPYPSIRAQGDET